MGRAVGGHGRRICDRVDRVGGHEETLLGLVDTVAAGVIRICSGTRGGVIGVGTSLLVRVGAVGMLVVVRV